MTFAPRFISLVPYSLGWGVVLGIALSGLPWFWLIAAIFIQSINTFSVRLVPIRVSIREGCLHCSYPLAHKTITFDLTKSECFIHAHPIPFCRFADFLVIESEDRKVVLWRLGITDFGTLCRELNATKA